MPEPTSQRQINRFAELKAGETCSTHEAARAVGISPRQGDRLAARPEIQQQVKNLSAGDGVDAVRRVVADLLQSDNETLRAKGAELRLRHAQVFDEMPDAPSLNESIPPGCERVTRMNREGLISDVIVYPQPPEEKKVEIYPEPWAGDALCVKLHDLGWVVDTAAGTYTHPWYPDLQPLSALDIARIQNLSRGARTGKL